MTGLTQDETYEFRVMAKNAVGSVSNPSMTAGPATCVDTYGRFLKILFPLMFDLLKGLTSFVTFLPTTMLATLLFILFSSCTMPIYRSEFELS